MQDLIFITAHCPTSEQEEMLDLCVQSVKKSGFHIAVISHTHIPIHIQKKCNFYFYDYLNETSDDIDLIGHENFKFNGGVIYSRFFQSNFYGFAIYRMFSIGSKIAKNFGYEKIHHLEYDCRINDVSILKEHSQILDSYDSVIYTSTGTEDGFLFGAFKSFKVNSLPDLFLNYNRDKIDEWIRNSENKYLENFTKNLFINSGNRIFFKKESDLEFPKHNPILIKSSAIYDRNIHFTLFYSPKDGRLNIFYRSVKKYEEDIIVIVNNEIIFNFKSRPGFWFIRSIGDFSGINHVRVDNSEKIIYQISFTPEFREIFKNKSYIQFDEEDN